MNGQFHLRNRRSCINALQGGIAVFTAYAPLQRGNDMSFAFEQEANFWWLTGIEAPNWQCIIDGSKRKVWLVKPHVSDTSQLFDGSLPAEEASRISGIEYIISEDEAVVLLRELAKKHPVVHALGDYPHAEHFDFIINPASKKLWDKLERTFTNVRDCRKELAKLRAIKQREELTAIRQAIGLTIEGFEIVKAALPQLKYEYEAEAEFSYLFKQRGAAGHAYDPIIASGKNACVLHYTDNNQIMKKKTLLMMDVGARYHGYAADISRTYAIGQPTKRQIEVHAAVTSAQKEIIASLRAGISVAEYHTHTRTVMTEALQSLGLMQDANDKSYYRYFPHAISHGLGVDVHDALGEPSHLEANMVLTVEPGIYIPEEGIGVRIEDDILITEKGNINLSGQLSTDL